MAGRTRTTKKLSQRIDREYFKRLFPIPSWRRRLTYILVGLGVLWLGIHAIARNQAPYNAGKITSSHAMFAQNCAACHVQTAVFGKSTTDQACSACHDGPIHQASQTYSPACTECHVEHKGVAQLAHASEKACTDCHANLQTKTGQVKVAAHIKSFSDGHPEFAALRDNYKDPGTIKFNHNTHLKKDLHGATGNVTLQCSDCHRPTGGNEPWPYGMTAAQAVALEASNTDEARPATVAASVSPHSRVSPRAYMGPVDYYEHCSTCHPLMFDRRINTPAPHKKPAEVHAFVVKAFQDYIQEHPEAIHDSESGFQQIAQRPPQPPARNAAEWVNRRVTDAEQLLWFKSCKECHNLQFQSADMSVLPDVRKSKVTSRWLQKGGFDHSAHAMLKCEECHGKARDSKETSDVLLPSIKSCQECHKSGTSETAGAGCYECHQYHDWSKEKHVDGKFTTHELLTRLGNHPANQ